MIPKRLVILAVDGLSARQFEVLKRRCPNLGLIEDDHQLSELEAAPLISAQAIWAELLTGAPWFDNGCPGYSKPLASLNDMHIVTEDMLNSPVKLLSDRKAIVANVPLLLPKDGRAWLSDGALPLQFSVEPAQLAGEEPFNAYKARPFLSAAVAAAQRAEAVAACSETELVRMRCLLKLVDTQKWDVCIARFSAFDLLGHLVGSDFLQSREMIVSEAVQRFLADFDAWLGQFLSAIGDASVVLLSSFSHTPCSARLNLNQLLARHGICAFARLWQSETELRRASAVKEMLEAKFSFESQSMATRAAQLDLSKSLAASPVQGAVYLNRCDRFGDGIVRREDISVQRERVRALLERELAREFGGNVVIWTASAEDTDGPDLMVHVAGAEMDNSADGLVVDRHNHPGETHCGRGFVLLPRRWANVESFSPIRLNQTLCSRLEARVAL